MTTKAGATGAGLTELLVSAALVGIVTAVSVPTFHSYVHGGALKAGAEELAALMNLARSVAIKDNTRVCVNRDPGGLEPGSPPHRERQPLRGGGQLLRRARAAASMRGSTPAAGSPCRTRWR